MPVTNDDVIKVIVTVQMASEWGAYARKRAKETGENAALLLLQLAFDAGYAQRDNEFGESEAERCPI